MLDRKRKREEYEMSDLRKVNGKSMCFACKIRDRRLFHCKSCNLPMCSDDLKDGECKNCV